jgi:hypothetical protein
MIRRNCLYQSWKASIKVKFLFDTGNATLGRNFDVTTGRAACEACSVTWNFGNSVFALEPGKITENRHRVGTLFICMENVPICPRINSTAFTDLLPKQGALLEASISKKANVRVCYSLLPLL